jgi:exopolysaccharide biosynthesis polyprenyl glycosylphosphotransferase
MTETVDAAAAKAAVSAPSHERRRRPRPSSVGVPPVAAHVTAPIDPVPAARWISDYRRLAVTADLVVITAANILGLWLRYQIVRSPIEFVGETAIPYSVIAFGIVGAWLLLVTATGGYDGRILGAGSDEFKRTFRASVQLAAVIGLACYISQTRLSRGYIATTLLLGTVLLLLSRYALRRYVHLLRRTGRWSHRVLAVGTREAVAELIMQTQAEPHAGFTVVAACLRSDQPPLMIGRTPVPVVGSLYGIVEALAEYDVDTVAVTRAPEITTSWLTQLAWSLEGSGVGLAVAPALTNVAGPRIAIRPVAGLPLLQVEEPELRGTKRLVKNVLERVVSSIAVVVLSPLLLLIAVAIVVDTRGPVFFRQQRVGQDGNTFSLLKFRSMRADADRVVMEVAHLNEADSSGFLFKIRNDPRVTRVGRLLRRYSLDELPQLLNVVRGQMALVGPRPPLPTEVAQYGPDVRRRLLVKPGITGLWQVSGRSDLSWDDTIRLDLYYVENWSLALDLQILWKTAFAVLSARGAY